MISKCNSENIDQVFDYIDDDYQNCLFTYIDLVKYGLDNENFNVWIQYNDENKICCIISEYYGGLQIYSKHYDLIASELIEFIKLNDFEGISGCKDSMDKIKGEFPNYKETLAIIGKLKELTYPPNPKAYSIKIDELKEVARIVYENENLRKHHSYESIYNQFYERIQDDFGRNFILRDENTHQIICHAATYAEIRNLAVIGGVITTENYRGKGYSKGTLSSICKQLQSEGKDVFSKFIIPPAIKMHYGVGFEKVGEWITIKKIK